MHGTTVLAIRRDGRVAMGADGQVTMHDVIIKQRARKVRRLYEDKVLAGFAGAVADAMTLFEKFEGKLVQYQGDLKRAAVELTKEWRTDRILRRLEALLLVADVNTIFLVSGSGEVVEPEEGVCGIGSGGAYAQAAAKALLRNTQLSADQIAEAALKIAAETCVYTNHEIAVEVLPS